MKRLLPIVLIFLAATAAHSGTTVEYPLPELTGPVEGDYGVDRVDTVLYHGPAAHVLSVRLEIRGSATLGLIRCEGSYSQMDTTAWWMASNAQVRRNSGSEYLFGGALFKNDGPFVELQDMTSLGISWIPPIADIHPGDRLIVSEQFGGGHTIPECWPVRRSEGVLTYVSLWLEIEIAIATQPTTWGRIKSLYRN